MPDSCLLRRFLNLRKSSSNLPLKVGDVKPVSTGNFFGNSTWRKLGVNLALFFLKNGLKIPHKTGWHKTVETKKCLQYQHFSHVTRQNQMFYPALVMRRSPVRVRSLAPENRRFRGENGGFSNFLGWFERPWNWLGVNLALFFWRIQIFEKSGFWKTGFSELFWGHLFWVKNRRNRAGKIDYSANSGNT